MRLALGLLSAAVLAHPASALAQTSTTTASPRSLRALRLAGAAPSIDGRLDEPQWTQADSATNFVQTAPTPGAPASEPTTARVLYDDDAVYVGVRCYDSPDSVVGQLARRDFQGYSDWMHIIIDSYHDRRTAFRFAVNPRGVQKDVLEYNDTNEDITWDAVWDAAAHVDSAGWTVEIRVPLSQLRFASSASGDGGQVWGINFMRQIARRNERAFWAPIPPGGGAMVSLFGELHGVTGLAAPRHFEVLPYSLGRVTRAPGVGSDPFYHSTQPFGSMGADVKYGVTSDLTLNATVNPDFGQVEADPSVVNLTAFETFFPEKRPFFVEGATLFQVNASFPYGIRGGSFGNDALFYSRRVGRSPHGAAPDTAAYVDMPDATTILTAGKLSGKTASGWSIGALDALTAAEHADWITPSGARSSSAVEPFTNYQVTRIIKDFHHGESAIGGILTSTNRRLTDGDGLGFLRSSAYAGGIDGRHRFRHSTYEVTGALLGSTIAGSSDAIALVQRSPAHYFQRPDATHLTYDPTRTSLSGTDADLKLTKINGGHWRGWVAGHARSPGLELNDLGYMRSADWLLEGAWLGYQQNTPTKHVHNWNLNANEWSGWTFGGEHKTTGVNTNGYAELANLWNVNYSIDHELPALSVDALRGGPALRQGTYSNYYVGVQSDIRHSINFYVGNNLWQEYETGSHSEDLEPEIHIRPSSRVQLGFYPGVNWNTNKLQYVTQRAASDGTHYVFAALHQTTAWMTTRVNYTFTPTLSLEVYAQPFVSAGRYDDYREVSDPRAVELADRYHVYASNEIAYDASANAYSVDRNTDGVADFTYGNPDFNFKEFRSNVVLRWEYRRGSTAYVVWSQGRDDFVPDGSLRLGRDMRRLFESDATNVLLVKVSYWLDV